MDAVNAGRLEATYSRVRSDLQGAARLAVAVTCGLLWGARTSVLAFLPLLFFVWWRAQSRLEALTLIAAYHLVAVRPLVVGGARYFDVPLVAALGVVSVGALVAAAPWACLWCAPSKRAMFGQRLSRATAVLLASCVPPLTAFAVPSVWTSAGVWFPGSGFVGIAAMVAVGVAMGAPDLRRTLPRRPSVRFWMQLLLCGLAAGRYELRAPDSTLEGAEALDTDLEVHRADLYDFARQWDVTRAALGAVRASEAPLVVLPESLGGLWLETAQREWAPVAEELRRAKRSVLLGVVYPTPGTSVLRTGAVLLGADTGQYVQRVPLPFAMYKPWARDEGFVSDWFAPSTLRVHGRSVALFVCWELGSPWAVFRSAIEGADALVVLADSAWLSGTGGARAQRQMLNAWSSLFGVPTVMATNLGKDQLR